MEIRHINYKSDFTVVVKPLDATGDPIPVPEWDWDIVFKVGVTKFVCSRRGDKFCHCSVENDTVVCNIDAHKFGPGHIHCEFVNYVPNLGFADGSEKVVTPFLSDIELVVGRSDNDDLYQEIDVLMPYAIIDAFQMAVASGYQGTKEEFVEALKNINSYLVDDALDESSVNPVQNKVVTAAINKKADDDKVYHLGDLDEEFVKKAETVYSLVSKRTMPGRPPQYTSAMSLSQIVDSINKGNVVFWTIDDSDVEVSLVSDYAMGFYFDKDTVCLHKVVQEYGNVVTTAHIELQPLLEIIDEVSKDSDAVVTSGAVFSKIQEKYEDLYDMLIEGLEVKADKINLANYLPLTGGTMLGDIFTARGGRIFLKNSTGSYVFTLDYNNMNYLMNTLQSVAQDLDKKQDKLVSGTNIKTINGQSVLGKGNIEIQGGSGDSYTKEESDEKFATKYGLSELSEIVNTNQEDIADLQSGKASIIRSEITTRLMPGRPMQYSSALSVEQITEHINNGNIVIWTLFEREIEAHIFDGGVIGSYIDEASAVMHRIVQTSGNSVTVTDIEMQGGGEPVDAYTKAETDAKFAKLDNTSQTISVAQILLGKDKYDMWTDDDGYLWVNGEKYVSDGNEVGHLVAEKVTSPQVNTDAVWFSENEDVLDVQGGKLKLNGERVSEEEVYIGTGTPPSDAKIAIDPAEDLVEIVQEQGTSTSAVMSQKAVTDLIGNVEQLLASI